MDEMKMLFPGFRSKALTLSYDDGRIEDIRLVDTMAKHGIRGTFNLNSGLMPVKRSETHVGHEDVLSLYIENGCEVALHGKMHLSLTKVSREEGINDINSDRLAWESIVSRPVLGMAYANGVYDDDVVSYLRELGVIYSRTVISSHGFEMPRDWLRLEATCHHNDPLLFELWDSFVSLPEDEGAKMFYLWGHSYEFPIAGNWDRIERFCETAGGRGDVWYATNGEIYYYERAFGSLIRTLDGRFATNPSSSDVYVTCGGRKTVIPAGKTASLT